MPEAQRSQGETVRTGQCGYARCKARRPRALEVFEAARLLFEDVLTNLLGDIHQIEKNRQFFTFFLGTTAFEPS